MATSVLLACGLNEPNTGNFIFIPEDSDIDGSFLISCILTQRIKAVDSSTVCLCFHHYFEHYCGAGMRLGANLNLATTKGQLKVIEPLKTIESDLFSASLLSEGSASEKLETLWRQLIGQVETLSATKKSLTIIIDDLSALITFGASENLLIQFCYRLQAELARKKGVSIIVKLNTANLFEHLANNLELIADMVIRVNKLPSGNFRSVDGRLVCERMPSITRNSEKTNKEMLYKVNDRNVKIFAPGEIGVNI